MKESDEIMRSDSAYQSVVAVIILCIQKDFHAGILELFEVKGIFIKVSTSISFTLV